MVAPDPGAGLQPVHPAPGVSPRGPAHVVLVAGRRAAMLLGLKRLLEPAFEVVGMPDNVLSLLDALRDFSPALLVMDTGSPEFGGADLPWRLRTRFPRLRILLVGNDPEPPPAAPAPDPGTGYIDKEHAAGGLVAAARALLARACTCDDSGPWAPQPSATDPPTPG
jgi:DNA-binding NarL/FixJ family response regulator